MRFLGVLVSLGVVMAACGSFGGDDSGSGVAGSSPGDDAGLGGPDAVVTGEPADYALSFTSIADTQTIIQGRSITVPLTLAQRGRELRGPITIKVTGLPNGVTADPLTLDGTSGNLVISATMMSVQGEAGGVIEATLDTHRATTPLKAFVRGAPGDLDTTWGNGGHVLAVTEDSKQNGTVDLVLGKNDDVYSVSGAYVSNGTVNDHAVHLDKNGVFDAAYGAAGVASFSSFGPTAAALESDGTLVVVGGGTKEAPGGGGFGLVTTAVHLPPSGGAPEWSIETGAPVGGLNGRAAGAYAVAVRDDGHILFGFDNASTSTSEVDCGLTHLDASGAPVTAFGSNGSERNTASVPIGLSLSNGALVVVSVGADVVDYVRYNADSGVALNQIPKTVTIAGVRRPRVGGSGFVTLTDQSIVAPFNGTAGLYLLKLDANGDPVAGFGTAGLAGPHAIGGAALATGITVDGNGKFLVALDTGGLVRFTASGDPDASFGAGGLAPDKATTASSLHRKVAVQKSTGRILASGEGTTRGQVVVSAYWP